MQSQDYYPFKTEIFKRNNSDIFAINSGKVFNFYNPLNYRNVTCDVFGKPLPKLQFFLNEERKTYGSKISLEVLGKLIGGDKNEDKPKIVRRENAVEVKFPREKVILQDEIEELDSNKNKRYYRE